MRNIDFKLLLAKGMKIVLNPPALRKCEIDKTARVCAKSELNDVCISKYSYVGNSCFMVNVKIGAFTSIADSCFIGGATHPMERVSMSPVFHEGKNVMRKNFSYFPAIPTKQTNIGNDVWLGGHVCVKAGVSIADGAVIGTGSVVTKDIGPYEIWAGAPAVFIRKRFDENIIEELLRIKWWQWDDEKIMRYANAFDDVEHFINQTF